ncbi:hypothetical protein [Desulfovibrio legallii]|uniref:hypothetical protein n=1 Tax=Desulfovibrio legallii TaxID=571438 RepID=UPI0015D662F1|nr:hypothetical protein [Desulfovibrio legallii]
MLEKNKKSLTDVDKQHLMNAFQKMREVIEMSMQQIAEYNESQILPDTAPNQFP